MKLRALKFVAASEGVTFTQSELETESGQALERVRSQVTRAAYVVRGQDLYGLRKLEDVTVDRREKGKAKELSRILLGHSRIPIVSGSYTVAGRLIQGIESLLAASLRIGESNIYIIGTTDRIFNKLWTEASGKKKAAAKKGRHDTEESREGTLSPEDLLGLLPRVEVPEDLVRSFVGDSVEVQLVRHLIMRAAGHSRPVLILGDTGTGKEVVARSIHKYSDRSSEKFVPVNCGAIPRELFEPELFGIKEKVATGVGERMGLWELAGKGTLFLDEIGDLSVDHQAKILRALQENKIRRIGEAIERPVYARVVTATNRDLFSMVQTGQFREDLYYRLRIFLIRTPAIRNHAQDIPTLAQFLWRRITGDKSSSLPESILSQLQRYRWPGNVREMKAVLMGMYTLFGKDDVGVEHLNAVFQLQGQAAASGRPSADEISLHAVECLRHLRRADEVIRACKVTLRPVVEKRRIDAEAIESVDSPLRHRLSELEVLCMRPLLFHNEVTFSVVHQLKGKLSYFHSLLHSDPKAALSYWRDEVAGQFKLALSAVFGEVERLTGREG
jgi:DNA-binding NtrC family response regulator